ncbi:hypothetical protein AJ78_05558 [Emergomyces pasteurianus Ep9510]|uniref:DUF7707 domain-containing protein n=1 Tax=Emergomyces pasteurianus Ep9510 TaxID=1447872 RepID=A0A1J9QDQ0_9EURO|nr:hypothetical protein AJ78_05558 [Emergomyces pasteurianus Ep9510]
MLLSTVAVALSLFATAICAQNFNPNSVSKEQKLAWCDAQMAACPALCKSFAAVNICNADDMTYTCTCGDGSIPDLTKYKNTMPFFICTETYAQCIDNHPDDLTGQRLCKENQTKCMGTLDPLKSPGKDSEPTTSRKAHTTTSKSTSSQTTATQPTATADANTKTPSNSASTLRVPWDSSVGILVAVFLAAFRFFA